MKLTLILLIITILEIYSFIMKSRVLCASRRRVTFHESIKSPPKSGSGFGKKPIASSGGDMKSLESQIQKSIDSVNGLRSAMRTTVVTYKKSFHITL